MRRARPSSRSNHRIDDALKRLVEIFLKGRDGEAAPRELLTATRKRFGDYTLYKYDLLGRLAALFKVQPKAALDIFVADDTDEEDAYIRRRSLLGATFKSAFWSTDPGIAEVVRERRIRALGPRRTAPSGVQSRGRTEQDCSGRMKSSLSSSGPAADRRGQIACRADRTHELEWIAS